MDYRNSDFKFNNFNLNNKKLIITAGSHFCYPGIPFTGYL